MPRGRPTRYAGKTVRSTLAFTPEAAAIVEAVASRAEVSNSDAAIAIIREWRSLRKRPLPADLERATCSK